MLANPANPDATLAFVEAATRAGDVRGAISALERMLLLNPDLPNIKLELGLLYRRIGQEELARTYLEQALASPDIPPAIATRARTELGAASRPVTRHALFGSVFVGGRFDTNANAAAEELRGRDISGAIRTGRNTQDEKDDVAAVASLRLSHRYDLGNQRGDSFDTNVTAFGNLYRDVEESNVLLLDLETGPRFRLGSGQNLFEVRPFLEASTLMLAGEHYRDLIGGGLGIEHQATERLRLDATARANWQAYHASDDNLDAEEREGARLGANAGISFALTPSTLLDLRLDASWANAERRWQRFGEIGGGVSLTQLLPNPLGGGRPEASIEAAAELHYADYDGPDPDIDPDTTRHDTRLDLRLSGVVPLAERLAVELTVGWTDNASNIPNEEYDNLSVLLGVRYNFAVLP